MVRRAVASNVGNFAGVVEGRLLLSDVVPVFEALASDDQDNVRLLAVEQAGKVAKALVDQVRNHRSGKSMFFFRLPLLVPFMKMKLRFRV